MSNVEQYFEEVMGKLPPRDGADEYYDAEEIRKLLGTFSDNELVEILLNRCPEFGRGEFAVPPDWYR